MSEHAPVHFSRDGSTLAVCDGPELLVYGGDGSPRWKHFCDGVLLDVRATAQTVVAIDTEGKLIRFRAVDGRVQDQQSLPPCLGFDATDAGVCLLVVPEGLVLVQPNGGQGQVPVPGASAASFGPDHSSIGVGWSDGTFRALDPTTGAAWGEVKLPGAVHSICWSARGEWVVAAGSAVHRVSGDGTEVVGALQLDAPAGGLALSANGVVVAAIVGHNQVVLGELDTHQSAGHLEFRRNLGGICFGNRGMLAISLDDGDATRVDVFTGASVRTEPHPGRGRNTWNFGNHVEFEILRGAIARAKAGGEDIARYVGPEPDGPNWWLTCLGVFLLISVVCGGATMCSGLAWYFLA